MKPTSTIHRQQNRLLTILDDCNRCEAYAERLLLLAEEIDELQNDGCEELTFGEYDDLRELETQLKTISRLLLAGDLVEFLDDEIEATTEHFDYIRRRITRATDS